MTCPKCGSKSMGDFGCPICGAHPSEINRRPKGYSGSSYTGQQYAEPQYSQTTYSTGNPSLLRGHWKLILGVITFLHCLIFIVAYYHAQSAPAGLYLGLPVFWSDVIALIIVFWLLVIAIIRWNMNRNQQIYNP